MFLLLLLAAIAPQVTVVVPPPPPTIISRDKGEITTARYEQDYFQDVLDSL